MGHSVMKKGEFVPVVNISEDEIIGFLHKRFDGGIEATVVEATVVGSGNRTRTRSFGNEKNAEEFVRRAFQERTQQRRDNALARVLSYAESLEW